MEKETIRLLRRKRQFRRGGEIGRTWGVGESALIRQLVPKQDKSLARLV